MSNLIHGSDVHVQDFLISPRNRQPTNAIKTLTDTDILTCAVGMFPGYMILFFSFMMCSVVLVLMHGISAKTLSKDIEIKTEDWILAISSFLTEHHDLVQTKVPTIRAQVEGIVKEIKNHKVANRLGRWRFSDKEAEIFAGKFLGCVESNLL
ncbi:hypothetical protein FPV67DRAFT_210305 [Lyophyllum atratum]|nr:hypothetical protein FPV67DRAFT_210305 [Lyophyllum atratum]